MAKVIANHALNHFLEGFEQGGGKTDAGYWKKRKRGFQMKKRGTDIGGVPRSVISDRALLVQSGTLRNAMQVISDTPERIEIGTKGVRYAAIHNYGLAGKAWGKHPFTMPRREFVGASAELNAWILSYIKKNINKFLTENVNTPADEIIKDKTIHTGRRGGRYQVSTTGKKVYLKRN